ncbi:MAG: hypothetical protein GY854_16240 [Deltaproteobacteria bacterium]|nr:hypothetical protein [Deltaproteobacteria bacterium]
MKLQFKEGTLWMQDGGRVVLLDGALKPLVLKNLDATMLSLLARNLPVRRALELGGLIHNVDEAHCQAALKSLVDKLKQRDLLQEATGDV